MPDSFAESADGVVLIANGIDPVLRWDGFSLAAQLAGIAPPDPDVVPVLAASFAGPLTGTYRAYVRFVSDDGRVSNLSAVSNELTATAAGQFDYSNLPATSQPGVDRRQVLRNTDGQARVFYVDVDTRDLTSTTLTGTKTDVELAASESVALTDGFGRIVANVHLPPPATKPFLCFHLGRMWLAGQQPYSEGSCVVAAAGVTVTGVGTQWAATFAGRFFYPKGSDRFYEIAACDPIAQTLTLTEAYEGVSDQFAEYSIKPAIGEGSALYYSEAGLPESWPPFNAFTLPEDGDEVTGLREFGSFLYVFKRRRTYRMTAQVDPAEDGFLFYALGRGCVNHRCHVVVEEMLYSLDEGGVYRTGGGDQAEQLSDAIQNLLRKGEPGAINWAASRYFHCVHSPAEETIRWFVALRGDYLPRTALCLHYKTGKWWAERYPVPVGCSKVGRIGRVTGAWNDAGEQLYLGGPAGELYASGGTLDGVPAAGPTTRGTVTAAGSDTLTDGSAAFDATWENVPVCVTGGRGKGQVLLVVSATATTLRVNEAWRVKPDATSTYQVGGIPYLYVSGRLRYAPTEVQGPRNFEIQFVPTAEALKADLRFVHDFSAAAREMGRNVGPAQRRGVAATARDLAYVIDLSSPYGHHFVRFDGHREADTNGPRLVRVELEGVSGPELIRYGELVYQGVVR